MATGNPVASGITISHCIFRGFAEFLVREHERKQNGGQGVKWLRLKS
jgi:hypothetical protein